MPTPPNRLYYGDNLHILRTLPAASVDLVYLDPPFNSNRTYNVLFKEKSGQASAAQLEAFGDTWQWDEAAVATFDALRTGPHQRVGKMINALKDFIGGNDMMAYLVMMSARLIELHRVLKPTGSLYLHCDPTASHYLKVVLDTIFGKENFHTEIIWKRTAAHSDTRQGRKDYGHIHDVILFYTKSQTYTWNPVYSPYDEEYVNDFYRHTDPETGRRYRLDNLTAAKPGGDTSYEWHGVKPYKGRYWAYSKARMEQFEREGRLVYTKTGMPNYKRYLDEMPGVPLQDLWDDITPTGGKERLGYPTQKPLALLERIIQASSNPGDVVLDPFCGCGTAVVAAQKLGRRWIGIDITHLAIALMRYRLRNSFGDEVDATYKVEGEPEDLESARALAQMSDHDGRYQFQWWALSLVHAQPVAEGADGRGKKGADKGIDGVIPFLEADGSRRQVIVSVKSGHLKPEYVREMPGILEREQAAIGVLITLEPPTAPMRREALGAGSYHSEWTGLSYPKVQILTIEDLFRGEGVRMPPTAQAPGAQAPRIRPAAATQTAFDV